MGGEAWDGRARTSMAPMCTCTAGGSVDPVLTVGRVGRGVRFGAGRINGNSGPGVAGLTGAPRTAPGRSATDRAEANSGAACAPASSGAGADALVAISCPSAAGLLEGGAMMRDGVGAVRGRGARAARDVSSDRRMVSEVCDPGTISLEAAGRRVDSATRAPAGSLTRGDVRAGAGLFFADAAGNALGSAVISAGVSGFSTWLCPAGGSSFDGILVRKGGLMALSPGQASDRGSNPRSV